MLGKLDVPRREAPYYCSLRFIILELPAISPSPSKLIVCPGRDGHSFDF